MRRLSVLRILAAATLLALFSPAYGSGFLEESSVSLTTRNYYLDRDFKGESPYSAAREWAQGFIFKSHSGYTDGFIGFGIDLTGTLGLQLDSSPDRTGTNLLPFDLETREPQNEYSELGASLKTKISKTKLSIGAQYPTLPIVFASTARLLPQSYRGVFLSSQDLQDLTLHTGHFDRVNQRDSTDYQSIALANPNRRFRVGATSNSFNFAGAEYNWSTNLTLKYFHAELEDIYTQDYLGFVHYFLIGEGRLKSDFRYFSSRKSGSEKAGEIDNRNVGLMMTYQRSGHSLGLGYMYQDGDTALPYIAGGEAGVISEGTMSADFINPKERTWIARYDYDFVAVGIPGLTGMVRYMKGTNIYLPSLGGSNLHETNKDVELAYVIQDGPTKGLAFRSRYAVYRNNHVAASNIKSANETRFNIDYTWKFK